MRRFCDDYLGTVLWKFGRFNLWYDLVLYIASSFTVILLVVEVIIKVW